MMDGRKADVRGLGVHTSKREKYIFFHCLLIQSEKEKQQYKKGAFYYDRAEKEMVEMVFTTFYTEIITCRISCVRKKNVP